MTQRTLIELRERQREAALRCMPAWIAAFKALADMQALASNRAHEIIRARHVDGEQLKSDGEKA
jgi:hypothetical protein